VEFTGVEPPAHAEVTFRVGGWLLPRRIDGHVHLCWDGTEDTVANVTFADDEVVPPSARAAAIAAVAVGVSTARHLGDRGYLSLALREMLTPILEPEIVALRATDHHDRRLPPLSRRRDPGH
jgi:imidazolonepropionase-like amidohydrolase